MPQKPFQLRILALTSEKQPSCDKCLLRILLLRGFMCMTIQPHKPLVPNVLHLIHLGCIQCLMYTGHQCIGSVYLVLIAEDTQQSFLFS